MLNAVFFLALGTAATQSPTPLPTLRPTDELTGAPTKFPSFVPSVSSKPTETCYRVEIGLIFDKYSGKRHKLVCVRYI